MTKSNTKEELVNLFTIGTPLSGLNITFIEKDSNRTYYRPFGNVLASNKHIVDGAQDFNGEPFLRGKFEYMKVMLPDSRLKSMNHFYRVLQVIINGYHVCAKANKDCLMSLANEIYHNYAPLQHVYRQTQERTESFQKIESIIDKILIAPFLFEGLKKYEPILWNPDYDLSPYEKSTLNNQDNGKALLDKNLQDLLELYTEGMTKKELIEKANLSCSNSSDKRSTVYRRWDALIELYNEKKGILSAA